MIIACPACGTRYAVPDNAIGVDGRTVRCAKCRHSWFQEGPEVDLATLQAPSPAQPQAEPGEEAPRPEAPAPQAPVAEPAAAASPAPPAPAVAPTPHPADDLTDDSFARTPSSFDHQPPFRPRRNPAKLWMALAIGFALVASGVMVGVARFGLPDWLPLPRASNSQPDLKLTLPPGRQERRPLANGNDFFNITGTITNIGQARRPVPPVLIVLRDSRNRAVYTVEVAPPKTVLLPGESVAINTAIVDAPKAAVTAEGHWKAN